MVGHSEHPDPGDCNARRRDYHIRTIVGERKGPQPPTSRLDSIYRHFDCHLTLSGTTSTERYHKHNGNQLRNMHDKMNANLHSLVLVPGKRDFGGPLSEYLRLPNWPYSIGLLSESILDMSSPVADIVYDLVKASEVPDAHRIELASASGFTRPPQGHVNNGP